MTDIVESFPSGEDAGLILKASYANTETLDNSSDFPMVDADGVDWWDVADPFEKESFIWGEIASIPTAITLFGLRNANTMAQRIETDPAAAAGFATVVEASDFVDGKAAKGITRFKDWLQEKHDIDIPWLHGKTEFGAMLDPTVDQYRGFRLLRAAVATGLIPKSLGHARTAQKALNGGIALTAKAQGIKTRVTPRTAAVEMTAEMATLGTLWAEKIKDPKMRTAARAGSLAVLGAMVGYGVYASVKDYVPQIREGKTEKARRDTEASIVDGTRQMFHTSSLRGAVEPLCDRENNEIGGRVRSTYIDQDTLIVVDSMNWGHEVEEAQKPEYRIGIHVLLPDAQDFEEYAVMPNGRIARVENRGLQTTYAVPPQEDIDSLDYMLTRAIAE